VKALLQGRSLTRFVRLLAIGSVLALSLTVAQAGTTERVSRVFVRSHEGCSAIPGPPFGVLAVRQLTSWPDATLTSVAAGINYDGSRVAIESNANLTGENPSGLEEVFAVNGDGTGLRQLTHGALGAKATWLSGNGEMICFHAPGNPTGQNPDGSKEVFVVSWDGTIVRQLTHNPDPAYGYGGTRISHDGQWVCLHSNADLTGENPDHNEELFVARSDGTVLRQLTHEADVRYHVSDSFISPDGQWIQFSSTSDPLGMNPDHSQEVFIINRYGTGLTQVTQNPDPSRRFDVSYGMTWDGSVLLIRGNANPTGQNPDGHDEAFIVNADGSGLRQLTCDPDFETGLGMLSYDGRLVSVRSRADFTGENPDHSWEVFLMKSDGSRITQISRYDGLGNPSVWDRLSGDGNRIAFTSNGNPTGGNPDLGMEGFIADLDTVPPTGLGISINGGARCTGRHDVSLSVTCNDCAEVRFRNDPGEWGPWEPLAATKAWTLTAGEGIKRVCAQGRDQGMNESAEVCDEILVYTLPPYYLAISINGGAACTGSREVTLTLAAMGVAEMRLRNESGAWSAWELFVPTKVWNLSAGAGLKTVGFQCRDECGNVSAEATDAIRLATFEDVGCGDPSAPYIYGLAARGIATGCSVEPPLFCLYAKVTRAEAAVLICRAAGKTPLERAVPSFADVPKTHWAYGYVERFCDRESWAARPLQVGAAVAASAGGLATGDAPGYACSFFPSKRFCPGAAVTREQIAWILCTAAGKTPMPSCSGTFADVSAWNPLCRWIERLGDARSWPGGIAVTSGCACPSSYATGARCFCPKSPATRAQMAVFLVRAFGIPM